MHTSAWTTRIVWIAYIGTVTVRIVHTAFFILASFTLRALLVVWLGISLRGKSQQS